MSSLSITEAHISAKNVIISSRLNQSKTYKQLSTSPTHKHSSLSPKDTSSQIISRESEIIHLPAINASIKPK